jgi:hypothetical protein
VEEEDPIIDSKFLGVVELPVKVNVKFLASSNYVI